MDQAKNDDEMWRYVVEQRLKPYIEAARAWWEKAPELQIERTGVFKAEGPTGFMYRMTNTPVRSPIKNVQAFPFVPVSYLQISGVTGGLAKMIGRVCSGGLKIDEFTVIEKSNLPSTYHQGQFLCIIPTEVYEGTRELGKYVYLTRPEMAAIVNGVVLTSVQHKMLK